MKNYINKTNQIFGFDETQKELITKDMVLIPEEYTSDQYAFLTLINESIVFDSASYNAAKQKNVISQFETAAQKNLDLFANSWGYDSLAIAASYANSTNPQFKAEAEALIAWRDNYWTEAYTIEIGALPNTVEGFLAMLPTAPTKPIL